MAVLVVVASGAGASPPALAVAIDGLQARASSAAISWRTSLPARVVVEYGLDGDYGVWSKASATTRTSGEVLLAGLEANTTYSFRLDAVSGRQSAGTQGQLTTGGISGWAVAVTTSNALFVDWQPLFPRMVWQQCPWAYPVSLAARINLFLGSSCVGGRAQLAALNGRAFSALGTGDRAVSGTGLIGWYQPDEPDEHAPSGGLSQLPPERQSKRVSFLTLGSHFFSATPPPPQGRAIYPTLVALADMIGFDLYPLQGLCRRDAFQAVYQAQQELVSLAGGKPTYQWIEAAPMHECAGLDPSPATVRAETWLAIAGGARGIGYFPSEWTSSVAQAITQINRQITSLSPALLGPTIPVAEDPANPIKIGSRIYNGATYIIAVNSSFARLRSTVTVPDLLNGQATVFQEHRQVPIQNGRISDYFRGLAVHIYVIPPAGSKVASPVRGR
jgi:hypothetical protein